MSIALENAMQHHDIVTLNNAYNNQLGGDQHAEIPLVPNFISSLFYNLVTPPLFYTNGMFCLRISNNGMNRKSSNSFSRF